MTMIDTYLDTLHKERHQAWSEQKAVLDECVAQKRSPSGEETEKIARLDVAIDKNDAEIQAWLARAERERTADKAKEAYAPFVRGADTTGDAEFRSFVNFLRGEQGNANGGKAFDIDISLAAKEKRMLARGLGGLDLLTAINPMLARNLTNYVSGQAGTLVPTDFVRSLYDYIEVYSGMRNAPVTIITTASGNSLQFPKVVAGGTATVVGEGTAIGTQEPNFGRMTLTSFKYGEMVRVSNELLDDEGVDLEGFLAKDFGRALGRVTNVAYTTGSGSNAPTGLMTVVGTALVGAAGQTGVPTFDELIQLEYAINSGYAARDARWMMTRASIGKIRQLKDSQGRYLWAPSNVLGQPDLLDGYGIVENPSIAATGTNNLSVVFGDFSAFFIRDVGTIRVARSDERYFDTDEVAWRATLRTDSNLIDLTGALKAYRGGTA